MIDSIKTYLKVYENDETREIFEDNEFQSNRLAAMVNVFCAVILLLSWVLNLFGVFTIPQMRMNMSLSCVKESFGSMLVITPS